MRIVKDGKRAGGNHQPDPPALQEGYSGTGVSGCKRSHRRDDRPAAQRGHAIFHISADGVGGRSSPSSGDRVQLQQVLMNLIMNSIDAMKDVDGTRT